VSVNLSNSFIWEDWMATLREQIETYIKRVKELAELVKGNEQATKQSLIGPFFAMLGYDLTDPRECIPEYKADFGKERSSKPIDWAFLTNGSFSFFVEAKEVGRKLGGFDEQLADYFAKDPAVKLGVLTNGAQWRFFTDVENPNVMDREPFAKWDVFSDEPAPFDVITLLQKASFNAELIRAFAQRQRAQNLLVGELTRLLEPASEFTKLAVANIETRNLTQAVVETWKPTVASALDEWARQRMLTAALTAPQTSSADAPGEASKVVTTEEELEAFATVVKLLGSDLRVAYEDSASYFKIHVANKRTWVLARLQLGRKQPLVWVPMPIDEVAPLASGRSVTAGSGWTLVTLDNIDQLRQLGDLFRAAYSSVLRARKGAPDGD
jgi:predicted type IV restriction endonuclease